MKCKSLILLALMTLCITNLFAQGQKVSGTVYDELGDPAVGVNVVQKGTTNGTVTDVDGKFTLTAPTGSKLVVSYIGYATQEVVVAGKKELKVVLAEDRKVLDEVVVVGYGTQKKANLTGAVAAVTSEVLEDRPISNLMQGLQGTIGNLNITSKDGQPGTTASFNIRGTTNEAGTGALVLVDGVEMDPGLLNPADVKEVSVLKDAASAAIYGAKAAFGVILITTKQGETTMKPKITFGANYSFNTPTVWYEGLNSLDYADFMNACSQSSNGKNYYTDWEYAAIKARVEDPAHNPEVIVDPSMPDDNKWVYVANTDWNSVINKKWYGTQTYNVGIQGGNKDFHYYSSVGLYQEDGITKWYDDSFKRVNNTNNLTYKVNSWLELGSKTAITVQKRDDSRDAKTYIQANTRPVMPVYHPDGNFGGYDKWDITNTAAKHTLGGFRRTDYYDIIANGSFTITPFKDLKLKGDYTYHYRHNHEKDYERMYENMDKNGNVGSWSQKPGELKYTNSQSFQDVLNLYADYTHTFGEKHNVHALVGFNQELVHSVSETMAREQMINRNIPYISLASGTMSVSDGETEVATRGLFYRLNYNYDEKYLFEFNGRYDGSSRFPHDKRFKLFPSASAGWRISQESFWEPIKGAINDLKIRASWGSLGNQNVSGAYPYILSYGSGTSGYLFGGTNKLSYISAPGLVSGNLTWETITTIDFGFDAQFFNNRLTASFDWYKRTTGDMLSAGKAYPAVLAVGSPQENASELQTKGWEAQLDWRDKTEGGLQYSIGLTVSDYTAEVTKYDNNPQRLFSKWYEGKKFGEIWGWTVLGLFESDEEAKNWARQTGNICSQQLKAGDLKVADLNGDGQVSVGKNTLDDPGDRSVIGNNLPRYSFGIRGTAAWKDFDLTVFFQGIAGSRDVELNWSRYYGSQWCIPVKWNLDYWTESNRDALLPRPRFDMDWGDFGTYDRYLVSGRYIRLKNLALGYTLPASFTQRYGVEKLRVYFNADNVFTIAPCMKYNWDPELGDDTTYPLQRSFSFGVNLTL